MTLVALAFLTAAPGADGADPRPLSEQLAEANQHLVQATRDYRASLERLLTLYQHDLGRASDEVARRREFAARGIISRLELEQSEQQRQAAEARVEATRRQIAEADELILEAAAREQLARLPALEPGGYVATDTLLHYGGRRPWSLAEVPAIERFFAAAFGRALPVSASGQTLVHDRLAFDHHNALDVALHPNSREGQALIAHLRGAGIPFLAFRGAVAGSSTGAHIHIGDPSPRLTLRDGAAGEAARQGGKQ
jgi:multidrug efflux pump subunit AcrA (membrane-fusion protein)